MARKSPILSILLCVYNGEAYLRQAVDSILQQSYCDFELVLVDDGSTDGAVGQIADLNDERIKIVRKKNTGLTDSLNVGLRHCNGQFIARHDADDISLPQRFVKQLSFLQKNENIGAVGCAVRLIDEDGDIIGGLEYPTDTEHLYEKNIQANQFVHGSLMFRRELLKKVSGYRNEFIFAQDYDLTLRCQEVSLLANLSEPLYLSRFGGQRISTNKAAEQAAIANMARIFAKQRRSGEQDIIQAKQYNGDYMAFADEQVTYANNDQVLLYLYLRAGLGSKARNCIQRLLARGEGNPIKLGINYILSFLPKSIGRFVYRSFDKARG